MARMLQHTLVRHSIKNAQAVVSWGGSSASSRGLPESKVENQTVETRYWHEPVEDTEGSQMSLMAVEALKSPPLTHFDPSFIISNGCPSRTSSVVFTFLDRQVRSRARQPEGWITRPIEKSPLSFLVKPPTLAESSRAQVSVCTLLQTLI